MDREKELEKIINEIIKQQNSIGIEEFEGYSPNEMNFLIYNVFDKNSPVKINKLSSDSEYKQIPFLNITKHIVNIIDKEGEIKLTQKGFLPTKIVKEIYDKKYLKLRYDFFGGRRMIKEKELTYVHVAKILLLITGIIKQRKNRLSLTKKGRNIIKDNHKMLYTLLYHYIYKFNWSYLDNYSSEMTGQLGVGYSLYLVSKYGNSKRKVNFYFDKYFRAFPNLDIEEKEGYPMWYGPEISARDCYTWRFFNIFLHYFGLVKIFKPLDFMEIESVIKLPIFDKLITISPPKHNVNAVFN
jgi:hypothetical protein